ncbi:MAG: 1-acyl-sn-glycerol-3-phosphate acyltransferase, partial [Firmicutes bacterium]|nr:1-acyl-sn-glycerol-3-phosphate acyltransferase [Candidatus Colimorpha enterica]
PNGLLYGTLRTFVATPMTKKMKLEIIDNVGVKNIKGPFIILSNHTSRCDWQYVGIAFKPHVLNYMASEIEFHRSHLHFIFDLMHLIPKKNFVPDIHSIMELYQVIRKGGNVIFFPEGKSSISGTNQPIMMGTSQLLKKLNIPVYSSTISGGYLSNTQWYIKDRPGKVEIRVNQLFTPEQTQELDLETMDNMINAALYNDDFEWNRTARIKYADMADIAHKLNEHLYFCPKCGKELTMEGEGNVFKCSECGNGATINEYYDLIPLDDTCVIPKTLRVWFELQRRREYRRIRDDENFRIEEEVEIGSLPNDHYIDKLHTSEIVGSGKVILDRSRFSFVGTKNGEPFELHTSPKNMATVVLPTDSSYFGAYFDREYYEFHPKHNVTSKWLISIEEMHRISGGKWKHILPQQQWIYEDDKPTDKEEYYL